MLLTALIATALIAILLSMAVNNDKVQITAGLSCSQLDSPPIGTASASFTIGFTDGDVAKDEYVILSTSPTALNSDLNGNGMLFVSNPSAIDVTLLSGATEIGKLLAKTTTGNPKCCVIPVGDGVIINATAASGTPTIGVTLIKITENA